MEYMDETTLAHKHTSPWLIAFRIIFTICKVRVYSVSHSQTR